MSQSILAETAGATAEQAQPNPAKPANAFEQVITDMSQLHPARDQSPLGGAGSGQKGQVPGHEQPLVNNQSNQEDPPPQEPSIDPFDPNYYDIVFDKDEEAVVYQRTARLYATPPTKWQT